MWLVSLPARGYHASPLPILTGWLTRLLEFCDEFHGFFVVDDPLTFSYLHEGGLLRISSGLEVRIGYFCFAEFSVLELSRDDFTEFDVLDFF